MKKKTCMGRSHEHKTPCPTNSFLRVECSATFRVRSTTGSQAHAWLTVQPRGPDNTPNPLSNSGAGAAASRRMRAFYPKGLTAQPLPPSSPFFNSPDRHGLPAAPVAPPPSTANGPEKGSLSFILNDEGRGESTSFFPTANENRGTTTAPARRRKESIGRGQVRLPMMSRSQLGRCVPERSEQHHLHPKRRSRKGRKGLVFHQVTFQIQPTTGATWLQSSGAATPASSNHNCSPSKFLDQCIPQPKRAF